MDASEGDRGEAPKVVLVYPFTGPRRRVLLESATRVVRLADGDEEAMRGALVDADAVVLRGPAKLTAELLAAAPRLRVIGAVGSGTDNIDVEAATSRGIPVVHGAGVAPRAVAEWVVGAMVACHRGFARLDRAVRAGSARLGGEAHRDPCDPDSPAPSSVWSGTGSSAAPWPTSPAGPSTPRSWCTTRCSPTTTFSARSSGPATSTTSSTRA